MTTYQNTHGKSGVVEYESGSDYIKIQFKGPQKVYVYDYTKPGKTHVDEMKLLAESGRGLATYISQEVKTDFSRIE